MIDPATLPATVAAALVAALAGYLAGSIPVAALVGRSAGVGSAGIGRGQGSEPGPGERGTGEPGRSEGGTGEPGRSERGTGEPAPGAQGTSLADVWRLAGPGWGMLALTGELAKGVLPVAIGTVTWSWAAGWAAGLGAVVGAGWPRLGRLRGDPGIATLAGVAVAISPAAGTLAMVLGLAMLGVARLLGRDGWVAAAVAAVCSYSLLFLAEQADPARLVALLVLGVVAAVRIATARR